jgi:DNA-binding NtrC family response regulator
MSAQTRRRLQEYGWPGNVRELRNVMEYAHVMGEGPTLTESELPPEFNEQARPVRLPLAPESSVDTPAAPQEIGLKEIRRALEQTRGSRARAASLLGISRVTLWRRLREAEETKVR